jgi:dTDP-4-dehydrorhamnose reductase
MVSQEWRTADGAIARRQIELWGGVECTVNRVGDEYIDQLEMSGHATRLSDLELIASLGIRTLRYPVLWERIAPAGLKTADWSWADERLGRLRELGIRPIIGLLHHGSGPRFTSLIDPSFPEGLAEFAAAVAARYPWVDAYTPVNEPLTTARFSGMYGHWYPHGRDGLTFSHALVNQCRAVALSMRAIRRINPDARLVQTEDLSKTHSTRRLSYQAEFENERRWLTFDLLKGSVDREHPMWSYLCGLGLQEAELDWFLINSTAPDIIGINHYLTSERFLDERLGRYPLNSHGGNDRDRYADVEAVRVLLDGTCGPRELLREAWERYRSPLAITEAHLGCSREEQLRWLLEVWEAAQSLRCEDVEISAVTVWSLFGAYEWNSLVTRREGHYEAGAFDLRAPQPRPTALAKMTRELATGNKPSHPALDSPGWWKRPDRLLYPPVYTYLREQSPVTSQASIGEGATRPLLITGASGTLGQALARACISRGLAYRLLTRREMDIADSASVSAAIKEYEPWAVVNAAGYVRVDDAERESGLCHRENTVGPAVLAAACAQAGVAFLTFSSDLVFDGAKRAPYVESDPLAPLNTYGRCKAEAEAGVSTAYPASLVVRTSAFFSPWDDYNFITVALRALAAGDIYFAADDCWVSPTYVPDLTQASLDLLIDGEQGVWHLANVGAITWADLARRAARLADLDESRVEGRPMTSLGLTAPRPRYSVLGSERGALLPSLECALARYCSERAEHGAGELNRKGE